MQLETRVSNFLRDLKNLQTEIAGNQAKAEKLFFETDNNALRNVVKFEKGVYEIEYSTLKMVLDLARFYDLYSPQTSQGVIEDEKENNGLSV